MSSLYDFEGREKCVVTLDEIIRHPRRNVVMGRMGIDDQGDRAAVFLRDPDTHYWDRGRGLKNGYALSEPVLNFAKKRGATVIYIAEDHEQREAKRVIEYDFTVYENGSLLAYSPEENRCVVGEAAVAHADPTVYTDRQRHVPDEEARRVWSVGDDEVQLINTH